MMKIARGGIIAFVCWCQVLWFVALGNLGTAMPGWQGDYEAAIAQARREGKPLVIDFGSPSCPACRKLERVTLSDGSVQQLLAGFVKVYVNGNEQGRLREQFGVEYYPTLVFLSPSGAVVHRQVGFINPNQMIAAASRVLAEVGQPKLRTAVATKNDRGGTMSRPAASAKQNRVVTQGARVEATTARGANLYDMMDVAQPRTRAKTAVAIAPAVHSVKEVRVEFAAQKIVSAPSTRAQGDGAGNEFQIAQALPTPKNIETPSPLLNVPTTPPSSQPAEAAQTNAPPADATTPQKEASVQTKAATELPASVKKLQGIGSAKPISESLENKASAPEPEKTAAPSEGPKTRKTAEPVGQASKSVSAKSDSDSTANRPTQPRSQAKGPETIAGKKLAGTPNSQVQKPPQTSARSAPPTKPASKQVTADDVERWFLDAESKLLSGYKKEAQAMYAKVVNSDPTNVYGKSDLAFIKMVALMVDRDDDLLRKKAYEKIREFLARYPNSSYRDYYTVVRATLAADLGLYADAHALLDRFPEEFPNSRYEELARTVWQTLPTKFEKPPAAKPSTSKKPTKPASDAKSRSSIGKSASTTSQKSGASGPASKSSLSTSRKPNSSASAKSSSSKASSNR